jgi:hypothetical protein
VVVVVEGGGGEEARRDPAEKEDRRRKKEEMRLKQRRFNFTKSLLPCRREHGKFTQKYSLKIQKSFEL